MSSEERFIAGLRKLVHAPGARSLTDDAAVLEFGGEALILTHDAMVEGIHFRAGQDPADVAWKLVATNISDLAAKGAEPVGVLLGYQLAADDAAFLKGLGEALDHFGAPLLGGDTVGSAGPQTLGLTALGRATYRPVPSRAGARPGDNLWLTGSLGAAMLAFEALFAGSDADTLAYRRPGARLREGQRLAPLVTAMMDVSDGLLLDARRMALASSVTIDIATAQVPIATPENRRQDALRWGDDYELLFTLPAGSSPPVPATRIGTVMDLLAVPLLCDGEDAGSTALGFEHGTSNEPEH
ncbi:thiamine-phosphate kinase [Novosphingobium aquimarinum]|uniref:thiamine-phosphate kinase n=1 Tax=Novosphingobium aquimarinum TaxID=2682494 RepID=UPI0012EB10FE|nr:thiamine-phosphate kinase [Novosphingobium aquimarinum]